MLEPPTVVLDTNVLEAAMRSRRGASFALVSQIGTGRFEIALSVPLLLEYEEVLVRQAGVMGRDPEMVTNLLDYLCAVAKRQRFSICGGPCCRMGTTKWFSNSLWQQAAMRSSHTTGGTSCQLLISVFAC
jgi:hypothetical protein